MKANKWAAMVATSSVLAVAAPASAQFGGLGALKKKLESAAKSLEEPTSPAAPTTPQSNSTSSQDGYATTPAKPINAVEASAPPTNIIKVNNELAPSSELGAQQSHSLESSDSTSKMEMAFRELQKVGAVTRHLSADKSESGLVEKTKPIAFVDTNFGPILLTGTETEDGGLRAASEFRVHHLSYDKQGKVSWMSTVGGLFHYGSEGKLPDYEIGYNYSDDLTLSFESNSGASGCFISQLSLVSIRRDGVILSDLIMSSIYSGPNNRTVEYSGKIVGLVKGSNLTVEVNHKEYTERAGKNIFSKNATFLQKYFYSNGQWSLDTGAAQIEMC